MFERFTGGAGRAVVLAQEEARWLGHNFIGTEHLLLGLIREGEGVAARALVSLRIDGEEVRQLVASTVGPALGAPTGSPPFTPEAKKTLEVSLREALRLGYNFIGTEHLLLALVRDPAGVAAQLLDELGVDRASVREQVITELTGGPLPDVTQGRETNPWAPGGGPRCPTCRTLLDRRVGYRVLPATPDEPSGTAAPIEVLFVYCLRCGVMLAHTPAAMAGFGSEAVVVAPIEEPNARHRTLRVIAEGVTDEGVSWSLRAGGDDAGYTTLLWTEDSAGVVTDAGMGGPKLFGHELMNVYSRSGPDRGPQAVVVRCDLSVRHLMVVHDDGTEEDMVDCGEVDGLRFGVLLAPPHSRVREVVGLDAGEKIVARCAVSRDRRDPDGGR